MRSLSLSRADFAVRELEPLVEDLRDKLAEHDTTCGLEHQVKVVAPPVKTRDEQVAGEIREREISTAAAAAQDKTEAPALDSLQLFPIQM